MSQTSWRKGNIFSLLNDEKAEYSSSTTKSAAKALQTLNPNTARQQRTTYGKNIISPESTFKNRPGKTEPEPATFKGLTTQTTEKFKPQEVMDKRRILPHSEDRRSRTGMDPTIRRRGGGSYNWGETIGHEVGRMHEINEEELEAQIEVPTETPIDKEVPSPEKVVEKPEEENYVTFSEYLGGSEERTQPTTPTPTGLLSFKTPKGVTTRQQRPREVKGASTEKVETEKSLNFQDSSTFPALS